MQKTTKLKWICRNICHKLQPATIYFENECVHVCVIALSRKNQDILTRVNFFVSNILIVLRHAVEIFFSISSNQKSFHYGKCRYFISFVWNKKRLCEIL